MGWRGAGVVLVVAAIWTVAVWGNRIAILAGDDRSAAFIAVHVVIGGISIVLGAAVGVIGWRLIRRGGPSRA
jgi:hypothetical protein